MLSLDSTLRVVFMLYAAFWVAVVIGTYFGVGALMKRAERSLEKHGPGPSGSSH